jgi:hypothetical protein
MSELEVKQLTDDWMYKEVARVHSSQRAHMKNGDIVKVTVAKNDKGESRSALFVIRGQEESSRLKIGIDLFGLVKLNVKPGYKYDFEFERISLWQKLIWALETSDPGARIAMWIAYWSAIIGVAGLVLGIIGVIPVFMDFSEWIYKKTTESHSTENPAKSSQTSAFPSS